jgi:transcriptional regulator with XRE-family HTH domain
VARHRRGRQNQEQIGRRVRRARTAKGWTREKLAEAIGVEVETLWRYEAGRLPISVAMLDKLADLLDIRIERLVGKGPVGMTSAETELLERWRMLDLRGQRAVMELLRWSCHEGERSTHKVRAKTPPEVPKQEEPHL